MQRQKNTILQGNLLTINDIQSFIAASEEIRIYNLTEIPIVKKPEFLVLIIRNRAFLVTPLKRPSINQDFKNFNLPK